MGSALRASPTAKGICPLRGRAKRPPLNLAPMGVAPPFLILCGGLPRSGPANVVILRALAYKFFNTHSVIIVYQCFTCAGLAMP